MRRAARIPAVAFTALDANLWGTIGYGAWGADGTAPYPSWRAALLEVSRDDPRVFAYGWRARLADSPVGSDPFDEGMEHLHALVNICPEARHLVHRDLLHRNVLIRRWGVSAVID